jgi:hypothetical protein
MWMFISHKGLFSSHSEVLLAIGDGEHGEWLVEAL